MNVVEAGKPILKDACFPSILREPVEPVITWDQVHCKSGICISRDGATPGELGERLRRPCRAQEARAQHARPKIWVVHVVLQTPHCAQGQVKASLDTQCLLSCNLQ